MTRPSLCVLLFALVACSAHQKPRVSDSELLLEAAYNRAWLSDTSWAIRVGITGTVEERIGRRNSHVIYRSRKPLSEGQLGQLRTALEEAAFAPGTTRLERAIEDAPEVALTVNLGGRLSRVVAEAPWDQACTGEFAKFAESWNRVLAVVPPSRDCGGLVCSLCRG
jgi:hypothetical protein